MINAKELRLEHDQNKDLKFKTTIEGIEQDIMSAHSKGHTAIDLEPHIKDNYELKARINEFLKKNSYTINDYSEYRDSWYTVEW